MRGVGPLFCDGQLPGPLDAWVLYRQVIHALQGAAFEMFRVEIR